MKYTSVLVTNDDKEEGFVINEQPILLALLVSIQFNVEGKITSLPTISTTVVPA